MLSLFLITKLFGLKPLIFLYFRQLALELLFEIFIMSKKTLYYSL
jgi:hypothetical protein